MFFHPFSSRGCIHRCAKCGAYLLLSLSFLCVLRSDEYLFAMRKGGDGMKSVSRAGEERSQANRSKVVKKECANAAVPSFDVFTNLPSAVFRAYPWLNGALFPLRSRSVMYCAIPKIASKTLVSLIIYVYLRDLIEQVNHNQTKEPIEKFVNMPILLEQLNKNGIQLTEEKQWNSSITVLERYLHLLRYESVKERDHSLYLNPWRLSLDRIFPEIHLKNVQNLSQLLTSSFTRAIFVRHPFERLASAYKERIATLAKDRVEAEPHYDSIRKVICRRYSLQQRNPDKTMARNACEQIIPSFADFIQYVLSTADVRDGITRMDGHWKPFSLVCQVCQFQYNFIGKYETFNEDLHSFLQLLHVPQWNSQKRRGASGHTSWQYRQLYSSLSDQLICRLKQLYSDDFQFFNYRLEEYINRTTLTC